MHSVIHWCANDKEQRSHITLTDNISSWTCQWIETWHRLEYLHCHEMRSLDASLSNSNVCLCSERKYVQFGYVYRGPKPYLGCATGRRPRRFQGMTRRGFVTLYSKWQSRVRSYSSLQWGCPFHLPQSSKYITVNQDRKLRTLALGELNLFLILMSSWRLSKQNPSLLQNIGNYLQYLPRRLAHVLDILRNRLPYGWMVRFSSNALRSNSLSFRLGRK